MPRWALACAVGVAAILPLAGTAEAVSSPRPAHLWEHALSKAIGGGVPGAVAGGVQVLTLMWMRTTLNYQYRYGVSFLEAFRVLYKDGGPPRFYKGLQFAILQGPLSRFGATAANDGVMALWAHRQLPLSVTTAMGALVAALWRVAIMPVDTCKTVLQVHGKEGFRVLMTKVGNGQVRSLYQGSVAVWLIAVTSHFPWFFVHNWLESRLAVPPPGRQRVFRNAFIGFASSLASDLSSNSARVLKIMKQSSAAGEETTYREAVRSVIKDGSILKLVSRGLATRMCVNAFQSMMFTVVWKGMTQRK